MTEEWRDIQGYEGLYQVSNLGRVKSLPRDVKCKAGSIRHQKEKILSPGSVRDGYQMVVLCNERERKSVRIHRLVAEAFMPNPNNHPEVNHKDRNTKNNQVGNLEWCTRLYNSRYDGAVERRSAAYNKPIQQLTMDGVLIKEYSSTKEASIQTGIIRTSISRAARGARSHAGGFKWRYLYKPIKRRYGNKCILSEV